MLQQVGELVCESAEKGRFVTMGLERAPANAIEAAPRGVAVDGRYFHGGVPKS